MLDNLLLKTKLNLLASVSIILVIFLGLFNAFEEKSNILLEREMKIKAQVETAVSLASYYAAKSDLYGEAKAQQLAIDAIRHLRYDDNNYFWIIDPELNILMHAQKPEKEGTNASDAQDGTGKYHWREMGKIHRTQGEGLLDYQLMTPTGEEKKISYVATVAKWQWIIGSGILVSDIDETLHNTLVKNVIIITIICGALFLVSISVGRNIVHSIQTLQDNIQTISAGDLSVKASDKTVGKDEMGKLTLATEKMRRQLHSIVTDVKTHSKGVNTAAQDISGAVREQAASSSQMSASIAEITSTMEEFSASSNKIAEHSKLVVEVAEETFASSKDGSEAMSKLNQKMHEIQQENQESLREIIELGNKSKEISKVMEIINSVTDQTKLIAFNAALEAASAGESGRRFSVVAGEIRRLADSVTESTSEIENNISQIQDSISRLVITSENGAVGIEHGMNATADTAKRLTMLVEAAERTSNTAQQISLSTQQQKTASEQVVVALREIVTASNHTEDSIKCISDISRGMSERSAQLDTLVDRFKLSKQQLRMDELDGVFSVEETETLG